MKSGNPLASHVSRTVTGPMWHGPALDELLRGVSAVDAAAHPIPGAHSIWELVLHMTAWSEIARARMKGSRLGSVTDAEDWPAGAETTDEAWAAAVTALRDSYGNLAREAGALNAEQVAAHLPESSPPHSVGTLIHGVIEHGTYHGGQIALLKRALRDGRAR